MEQKPEEKPEDHRKDTFLMAAEGVWKATGRKTGKNVPEDPPEGFRKPL